MTEAQLPTFDFLYVIDDGETVTPRKRSCTWPAFLGWLDEMADRDLTVTDIACPIERPASHHTIGTVDIGLALKDRLVESCLERGVSIRQWVTEAVRAKLGVPTPGSLGEAVDSNPYIGVGRSQGHRVVLGRFPSPEAARAAEATWYRWRETQRDIQTSRKAT